MRYGEGEDGGKPGSVSLKGLISRLKSYIIHRVEKEEGTKTDMSSSKAGI